MNIFKFGRGDFFGIIIPGTFLVLNLIVLFNSEIKYAYKVDYPEILSNKAGFVIIFFLIISYAFGFGLRVIKPIKAEQIIFVLFFPIYITEAFIGYIKQLIKKNNKENKLLSELIILKIKVHREHFPYIDWFYHTYLNRCPISYREFYKNFLKAEFNGDIKLIEGQSFINSCKIFVYGKSNALRDEIIFCEGLIRFLSGMFFSLLICIIIIPFKGPLFLDLLYPYLALLLIFGYRLRHIRVKEVLTVLDAFAFTVKKDDSCFFDAQSSKIYPPVPYS